MDCHPKIKMGIPLPAVRLVRYCGWLPLRGFYSYEPKLSDVPGNYCPWS